ncbi:nuclear transport factor 2 family protein [Paenibacillus chitinolyticus]|uniref:nuclear transport factor 2 family protein n=1 Tax=Paenibacillus chitinolyticus TaxID=79263 RepID=UPI002DBF24AA|nr:nuclear transport factor 2 family protein [Paenibacillus chitinolyticus]MEC0246407.1 nuclear transport factor 2 family protein [Paenibacillus chitinolyticus]
MENRAAQSLIEKYVEAYNAFDIEGMLLLMHEEVVFRNISNGVVNAETEGKDAFRELAGQSQKLFSQRCQTITDYAVIGDRVEVGIDYEGTLAADLPHGPKAGEKIALKGKSVFKIEDGKLLVIKDYS